MSSRQSLLTCSCTRRQKHTDYRGYQQTDEVVQWFWKVRSLARLLHILLPSAHFSPRRLSENTRQRTGCGFCNSSPALRDCQSTVSVLLLSLQRHPLNPRSRTGFKDLQGSDGPRRFTLEKVAGAETGALPKSHTVSRMTHPRCAMASAVTATDALNLSQCFNRLDLPAYSTIDACVFLLPASVRSNVVLTGRF